MQQTRLDDGHELLLVSGKTSCYECRSESQRQKHAVDRCHRVRLAAFAGASRICAGRELSFRETIHAVVFENVEKVYVSAHGMAKLSKADRKGVAVARNADHHELAVRGGGTRRNGGHAAVNAVKAVRFS